MSIRLQIILPLVLAIFAGVGVSFLIGQQATEGQQVVAGVVEQALDARETSSRVALALDEMQEDLARVLTFTTFVPKAEVERLFATHDAAIVGLLEELGRNTLSDELRNEVAALAETYGTWRDSLNVALGLTPATAIPTTEMLAREQRAVLDVVAALDALVGDTARSRIAEANRLLEREIGSELTALAIGGGVVLVICLLIARGITSPIVHVTRAMNQLAGGATDVKLPRRSLTREINNMVSALEVFRDNAVERLRLENESATAQAERRRYADEMARLIEEMSEMMDGAVHGDFSGRVRSSFTVQDLRVLAENANRLVATVDANVNSVLEVMTGLAEGDLDQRMDGEASGAFAELQVSVNSTFDKLVTLIRSIRAAADTVSRVSGELQESASDLSQRTEFQAASLEETAATLEEITQTVKQSEKRAREGMERVTEARSSTEKSGAIVRQAVSAMGRIEQASGEIGNITDLIDEIAFQTNLLALNAGVEAARAGDAGKGFAVVAQEVRALAQRSAEAAKEIKALIGKTRTEVSSGVGLVNAAGTSLETIEAQVAEIDEHIRSISVAAQEQSEGVLGINGAVGKIDRLTQENAGMVQKTVQSVGEMSREARELIEMISHFRADEAEEDAGSYYAGRAA